MEPIVLIVLGLWGMVTLRTVAFLGEKEGLQSILKIIDEYDDEISSLKDIDDKVQTMESLFDRIEKVRSLRRFVISRGCTYNALDEAQYPSFID